MKCSLCGYVFKESEMVSSCASCTLIKGCKLIRCPRCGFETPPEPKWLRFFRKRSAEGGSAQGGKKV